MKHIALSRVLHIFPSKALFCELKYFWKIFNQGQYRLIHNVQIVNFDQSLTKSNIQSMLTFVMFVVNSDQANVWTMLVNQPYCPFKDSTYISIESSFLLIEIFLKNFSQGQYVLIHIVHLVNFDQSLSKSHIVPFMFHFTIF